MSRPLRVTWFAAFAMLALCAVFGALGWQWLALEREVATRRSTDSALSAMASLRRDLDVSLTAIASHVAERVAKAQAPFARASTLPPTIEAAVVFDAAGRPAPEGDDMIAREAADFARVSNDPAWRSARISIESLESMRRPTDALAAARQLLSRTSDPALKADLLVTMSRLASAAGDRPSADHSATQVFSCCRAARDEFGLSFLLYAVRQRLMASASTRDGHVDLEVGATIREAIASGELGTGSDEDSLRQIDQRWPGRSEIARAIADLAAVRHDAAARADLMRRASAWLADQPAPGVRFGELTSGARPEMFAAAPAAGGGRVVMRLAPVPLGAWVTEWSTAHATFDMVLETSAEGSTSTALVRTPLASAGGASWQLAARVRPSDPGAEGRRERLFVAAIGAAMLLAVLTGVLVVRDVSREVRLASLQSAFVAGVTHELKTPLTSIRLLAETLRSGRARPDQSAELLDTLAQEAERVTRLVDNVLSSSRIQSGMRTYVRRPALLQDVVETVRRRFESVLASAGFTLTIAVEPVPLRAAVDCDAFEQALLNLLTNAAKYSDASAAPEIRLVLTRHGQEAEARVEDRGRGIELADRRRVFDRFYRAPDVQSDTAGAGLGLTLVKHFADAHGGRVSVDSEPGRGSAFSIWLPLVED